MSLILHGVALSPFVRKVRAVLTAKSLPYDIKTVVPYRTPEEYSNINPLRRIPALEDDGTIICDSAVICDYLEQRHPSISLYPDSPAARAQCLWLEKYADYELAPDSTFKVFYQQIVCPTLGKPSDNAIIQQAITELIPPHLNYLESQLKDDWFVENQFSIADIAIASQLINLEHAGLSLDASRWPALSAHLKRVSEHPALSQLLEEERAVVKGLKERFGISGELSY